MLSLKPSVGFNHIYAVILILLSCQFYLLFIQSTVICCEDFWIVLTALLVPVASWRDKWSPQPDECLLINLKFESPSALRTHQVTPHQHTHTHTCLPVSPKRPQQLILSHSYVRLTSDKTPSSTLTAFPVCLVTHAWHSSCVHTRTHAHPLTLTVFILLQYSCDRCSLYFCKTI